MINNKEPLPAAIRRAASDRLAARQAAQVQDPRMRNGGSWFMAKADPSYEIADESSKLKDEEPIDFALSTQSPYLVNSGGADENSVTSALMYGVGYQSMQANGLRSQSMKQVGEKDLVKGAVSSRLTSVISPIQVLPNRGHRGTIGSTTYKQETTDSDFFNLTAEDES